MGEQHCHFVNALTALVGSQQTEQQLLRCECNATETESHSQGFGQEQEGAGWAWNSSRRTWQNTRLVHELREEEQRSTEPRWDERVVRATAEAETEQRADELAQGAATELDSLGIDIEAETTLSLGTVAALAVGNERMKHFRAAERSHEREMCLWFARPDRVALLGDKEQEDETLGQLVQLAEDLLVRRLKDSEARYPGQ